MQPRSISLRLPTTAGTTVGTSARVLGGSLPLRFAALLAAMLPHGTVGSARSPSTASFPQPIRPGALRPAEPSAYDGVIAEAARKEGLDEQLVRAVVEVESGFQPRAVSPAGAVGLMQLMPGTARSLGVKDSYDPVANVAGGARYLRAMLDKFGSLPLALAAYNAGPGAVEKYGGVPPYQETVGYVDKVLRVQRRNQSAATARVGEGEGDGGKHTV